MDHAINCTGRKLEAQFKWDPCGLALKKVEKLPTSCRLLKKKEGWKISKTHLQFEYFLSKTGKERKGKKRKGKTNSKNAALHDRVHHIDHFTKYKTSPCYVTIQFSSFLEKKKHDWRVPGLRINGWWTGTLTCRTGPASPRRVRFQVGSTEG